MLCLLIAGACTIIAALSFVGSLRNIILLAGEFSVFD